MKTEMQNGEIRIGSICYNQGSWKWLHGTKIAYVVYKVTDADKAAKYCNPARSGQTATVRLWTSRKVDSGTIERPRQALLNAIRYAYRYAMDNNQPVILSDYEQKMLNELGE
jgi:hypothetical protein